MEVESISKTNSSNGNWVVYYFDTASMQQRMRFFWRKKEAEAWAANPSN